MLTASKLPEFLWEPAVAHAAYVQNRAYTTSIKTQTPYQGWYGTKPNVLRPRLYLCCTCLSFSLSFCVCVPPARFTATTGLLQQLPLSRYLAVMS